jgi:hypothetical protein
MNNIYQLVLINCNAFAKLLTTNPSDYHSEIRKIPISETCLVPRVSDNRLYTFTSICAHNGTNFWAKITATFRQQWKIGVREN